MGGHFSKEEDSGMSQCVLNVIHGGLFAGAGLIAIGYFSGHEGITPRLPHMLARWGGYSIIFGSQIWNSFISKPILVRIVPRHTFGEIQSYLLPAYFTTQFVMAAASIGLHLYIHPYSTWTRCERMVISAMSVTLVTGFLNMTVLMKRRLYLKNKMFTIEREAGVGQQIGSPTDEQNKKLQQYPAYTEVKTSIGHVRIASALVNLVGIGSSVFHMVYLSLHGP